jgi:hypothetical protein
MKTLLIVAIALAVLLIASQVWAYGQVRQIETLPYQVDKAYPDFEVRHYATANFISVTMAGDTYRANSGQGFRTLAGYIFGGNATGQKIAMTTPVEMEMDSTVTMKFMLPAEHDPKDLPARPTTLPCASAPSANAPSPPSPSAASPTTHASSSTRTCSSPPCNAKASPTPASGASCWTSSNCPQDPNTMQAHA